MSIFSIGSDTLEAYAKDGGAVGCLAILALGQRKQLRENEERLKSVIEAARLAEDNSPAERQVRELQAENRRLKRIIAELQSRG